MAGGARRPGGPSAAELVPRLLARDPAASPRTVARALTLLEGDGRPARQLVQGLYAATGRARRVGITGPPGAGKSTLIDRLARFLRSRSQSVGILAVDPSSPFSGGALLGDRLRMPTLATDRGVFVRSMATRGELGGLARATHDAIDVLDAVGFDWVLVETVGVGQDEVEVVGSVDSVVVVLVPGLGDEIQAGKAGLMEIADVFVMNKADREGADRAIRDVEEMLSLDEAREASPWRVPVVRTVATAGEGIEDLAAALDDHRAWLAEDDRLGVRRGGQLALRVERILAERVRLAAERAGLRSLAIAAAAAGTDPYTLADQLGERVGIAVQDPDPAREEP